VCRKVSESDFEYLLRFLGVIFVETNKKGFDVGSEVFVRKQIQFYIAIASAVVLAIFPGADAILSHSDAVTDTTQSVAFEDVIQSSAGPKTIVSLAVFAKSSFLLKVLNS
jgi:hypothetical protein